MLVSPQQVLMIQNKQQDGNTKVSENHHGGLTGKVTLRLQDLNQH